MWFEVKDANGTVLSRILFTGSSFKLESNLEPGPIGITVDGHYVGTANFSGFNRGQWLEFSAL